MRLQVLETRAPAVMNVMWTPCTVGETVSVCLEARDYHAVGNTSMPSMSSSPQCLFLRVHKDPAPFFDATASQVKPAVFTIGKKGSFQLAAGDDNCADELRLTVKRGGEPLPADAVFSEAMSHTAPTGCIGVKRQVTWTPSYKYGGYHNHICFVATDMGGKCGGRPQTAEHCVPVEVRRCVYAMQYDQQLQHVAAVYGTDWMRMWSVNTNVLHPDYVPFVGQTIEIGHLFRMDSENEMPGVVARRMGMSIQQLKDLNYDVDMSRPLRRGQMLCVIPDSCKGMAKSIEGDIKYVEKSMIGTKWDTANVPQAAIIGKTYIHPQMHTYKKEHGSNMFHVELDPSI
jgi:hypothetical protein